MIAAFNLSAPWAEASSGSEASLVYGQSSRTAPVSKKQRMQLLNKKYADSWEGSHVLVWGLYAFEPMGAEHRVREAPSQRAGWRTTPGRPVPSVAARCTAANGAQLPSPGTAVSHAALAQAPAPGFSAFLCLLNAPVLPRFPRIQTQSFVSAWVLSCLSSA